MRIVIVVKKQSEYYREAVEWQGDFQRETRREVELIDPETMEGEIFASARDIVQYPAVVVLGGEWGSGKKMERFTTASV